MILRMASMFLDIECPAIGLRQHRDIDKRHRVISEKQYLAIFPHCAGCAQDGPGAFQAARINAAWLIFCQRDWQRCAD